MSTNCAIEQVIRGAMSTPGGHRIPMKVCMRPVSRTPAYSHIGEIDIPSDWIDEFAKAIRGFVFRSEDGECFTQFQILEDRPGADGPEKRRGRIILMRDVPEEQASEAADAKMQTSQSFQKLVS